MLINKNNNEVHVCLWLWLPIVLFVIIFGTAIISRDVYDTFFTGELGIIELATPILLIPALISGFIIFINRKKLVLKQLGAWALLMTLACVYFAGEEISWGQQLVGWGTPEWIKEVNDQQETNLHNMSSWFDQKPRLLLEMFVLFGGIIMPLKRKLQGKELSPGGWQYWLYPSYVCLPVAILVIFSRMPERTNILFGQSDIMVGVRCSEIQELYFATFLMLYLLSIRSRLGLS